MKLFSRFLCLLTFAAFAVSAHAATLTISDNSAPHADILRYEPFYASLTATVYDEPKSNDEIKVTGPSYSWTGGGDGLHVESSNDSHAELKSAPTPYYGSVENLKNDGSKKATVTCIAVYSRVNKKTDEPLDSISVPGSLDVSFFVRVPKLVESYGKSPYKIIIKVSDVFPGDTTEVVFPSPFGPSSVPYRGANFGINDWGAGDVYKMKLSDNKGEHYGHGVVYEDFLHIVPEGENPNGNYGPYHWSPPTWEDTIEKARPTRPADFSKVWLKFDQPWRVEEYGESVKLNTHHLELTPNGTTRTY